ncbi:hypothetical protein FB451DRAFT_1166700 [Mycena latifolia]|nr:hypothetical protein FB451DRAFT_1166700 [Mycena latifolia]
MGGCGCLIGRRVAAHSEHLGTFTQANRSSFGLIQWPNVHLLSRVPTPLPGTAVKPSRPSFPRPSIRPVPGTAKEMPTSRKRARSTRSTRRSTSGDALGLRSRVFCPRWGTSNATPGCARFEAKEDDFGRMKRFRANEPFTFGNLLDSAPLNWRRARRVPKMMLSHHSGFGLTGFSQDDIQRSSRRLDSLPVCLQMAKHCGITAKQAGNESTRRLPPPKILSLMVLPTSLFSKQLILSAVILVTADTLLPCSCSHGGFAGISLVCHVSSSW